MAFAGFFYDVALATMAHLAEGNHGRAVLAVAATAVTGAAFAADAQRRAAAVSSPPPAPSR